MIFNARVGERRVSPTARFVLATTTSTISYFVSRVNQCCGGGGSDDACKPRPQSACASMALGRQTDWTACGLMSSAKQYLVPAFAITRPRGPGDAQQHVDGTRQKHITRPNR